MPHATLSPAPDHPAPATRATAPPTALTFEERLTLVNTAMDQRLDEAAVAHEVNTAHIPTEPMNLADVITGPVTLPAPPEPPYPTPAAATLQRAARRLRDGGWCRGATVDAEGARCLYGALHAEAPTAQAEGDALAVLLDAIRRHWPDAETIPDANDHRIGSWRVAVRLLDQAAALADARGL